MTEITATEASRKFSDVLDKVVFDREEFEVVRGGRAVARIVPAVPAKSGSLRTFIERRYARPVISDPTFVEDMEAARKLMDDASQLGDPWER